MASEVSQADERPVRSGGRGSRRALRSAPDLSMLPALKPNLPLCEVMDGAGVERIDAASMAILEDVGVVFRDAQAIEDWKRVGADVQEDQRVHLDRGLVRELIATVPATFTYRARNPARSLPFGGPHAILVPMTGAPFLRDLDDVRRWPTLADLGMFHKLAHMSPALHSTAHPIVEPVDLPVSRRHLHITYRSPPPWRSSTPRRCRPWPTRRSCATGARRSTATTCPRSPGRPWRARPKSAS